MVIYSTDSNLFSAQGNLFKIKNADLDSDAATYLAAVEMADNAPLEVGVRTAINNFIKSCKADGIWSVIKSAGIMAGARTLAGALVPLKGPSPINYNFVSGDYNRKTGLIGDGLTKYLDTNMSPSILQQDNHSIGVYVTTPDTTYGNWRGYIGSMWMENRLQIAVDKWSSPGSLMFFSANTDASWIADVADVTGLIALSRSTASEIVRRYNQNNSTVQYASNGPFRIDVSLALYRAVECSNARMSFYWTGESADLVKFDTRVQTLMTNIGSAL
jgi:hypothetical protein